MSRHLWKLFPWILLFVPRQRLHGTILSVVKRKKDSSVRQRGFILILLTSCLFGLGVVLAKILGEAFNPIVVSWLSLFCGGIVVSLSQLLRRKPLLPRLDRTAWIDVVLLAGIGTALPLVCVVEGMAQTSAI